MLKFKNKKIQHLVYGIAIGIIVAIIGTILSLSNPFDIWHLKATNQLFTKNAPNENILIVAIDADTVKNKAEGGLGKYYEWRRTIFADTVKKLEQSGAAVIGLDILFTEPSRNVPQETVDELFNEATTKGEAVFDEKASDILKEYIPLKTHPDDIAFSNILQKYDNIVLAAKTKVFIDEEALTIDRNQTEMPYAFFQKSTTEDIGFVDAEKEKDNLIRKVPLQITDTENNTYDAFSLRVAQKYTNNSININEIPVENGHMIINFQANPFSYQHISLNDVLNDNFNSEDIQGKIVLIGITTNKIGDQHATPKSEKNLMPGAEIHANAVQTILEQKFLTNQSQTSQILTIILLAVLGSLILAFLNIWLGIPFALILFLGYYETAHAAYRQGIIVNMVYPFITILMTYLGSIVYKYFGELREKKYVKDAFGRYLSPNIMNEVLKDPKLLHLGGMKREITVFFSDIAGFTTVSEKLDPQHLLDLINDYLSAMTDIVLKYDGTLDKYVGDAIVAYFGAPVRHEDHAKRACNVALEMRQTLPKLHEKWKKEGKPLVDFRIGINTGEAIVGNVGSEKRFDYTIMGDEVNLGSRLEGANKKYGTNIMLSEATYEMIKDDFMVRKLDYIRVKGKQEPVRVFELLSRKGKLSEEGRKLLEKYNEGITLYLGLKFKEAYRKFKEALEVYPDDGPSKMYLQRCDILSDYPPPEDWDGVFTMQGK